MATPKVSWTELKKAVSAKNKNDLVGLIGDLYGLNQDNKNFICVRLGVGGVALDPYKKIISEAINPQEPWKKDVSLAKGRKAVNDYYKATKDRVGQIELMLYYIESGNHFTLTFGDIDEGFYNSLESMFNRTLKELTKQPKAEAKEFVSRLERINNMVADKVGWGYPDYVAEELFAFQEKMGFLSS